METLLSFALVIAFLAVLQVGMWYGVKGINKLALWNWERKINQHKAQQKKEALLGKSLRT